MQASQLVILKDDEWIKEQKVAGSCVKAIHDELVEMTTHTTSYSGFQYEIKANEIFKKYHCEATFHQYKGFPSTICLSINKELVHGIPSEKFIIEGDVVSFDLGATFKNGIADAAVTVIKGKAKDIRHEEIIKVCKEALVNAISSIKVGEPIGSIGYAIDRTVKKTPYGLVTHYGGHGINAGRVHAEPFIHNKSKKTDGVRVQRGLSIAIEPMVTLGRDTDTKVMSDGWTVMTKDIGCHFEHSVTVNLDGEVVVQTS